MATQTFRFADFELDIGRYQLRRGDRVVKLEKNPMELLILLVERQGEMVTREEIIQRLWGDNVYVDTRHGINTTVHKLRSALRDDSERPRILETVVGKGYRLIAGIAITTAKDRLFVTSDRASRAGKANAQNVVAQVLETESNASSGDAASAPPWQLAAQGTDPPSHHHQLGYPTLRGFRRVGTTALGTFFSSAFSSRALRCHAPKSEYRQASV